MEADPKTFRPRCDAAFAVDLYWTRHTPRGICPPLDDGLELYELAANRADKTTALVVTANRIAPARRFSGVSLRSLAERCMGDHRLLNLFASFYAKRCEAESHDGAKLAEGIEAEYRADFDHLKFEFCEAEILADECDTLEKQFTGK